MKFLLIIALALTRPPKVTLTWTGQATQVWRATGNCWNASKLTWVKIAQIPPASTYTDLTAAVNTMYCWKVQNEAGQASNPWGAEVVVVP